METPAWLEPRRITNHIAQQLLAYLNSKALVDVDHFLEVINLSKHILIVEDEMLPVATHIQLLEEASRYVTDPAFGLHLSEFIRFEDLGAMGYLAKSSRTLSDWILNVTRFMSLNDEGTMYTVETHQNQVHVTLSPASRYLPASRQYEELNLLQLINSIRLFVGPNWHPDEVSFGHEAPEDLAEHERLLCVNVHFDQPKTKLVFDASLLTATRADADPNLNRTLKAIMNRLLEYRSMANQNTWLDSVKRAIKDALVDGTPGIADMAALFHCSTRTFQRKLAAENLTYKKLLDGILEQLATDYLTSSDMSIAEITLLLGYSEVSAFTRAFRRWTGCTPNEYRSLHKVSKNQAESASLT